MTVDERTRLFTFGREDAPEEPWADLLVRSGPVAEARFVVTEVGADHEAVDPVRSGEVLFDLGLGRSGAAFGVRTSDPATLAVLRRCVGMPLDALPGDAFAEIVERSPTRVVTTALGRIEVRSPIPPPDGTSPRGAHTHLRPEHLDATGDWPAGFDVPTGWTNGAAHYLARS